MTTKPLFLFSVFSLLLSCNLDPKPELWPANPTCVEAVTYELNLADTSKIFTREGVQNIIMNVSDSLITKHDTIFYNTPEKGISKFFPGLKIRTTKTYKSNPSIKEYYLFDKGAVKLAGYATGDSVKPVTAFTKPLVIFPKQGVVTDSTIAMKQNWISRENAFKEDTKTRTVVKLVKTGTLIIKGQKEEFLQYELTLTSDAKVGFGGQELIVPDAIYMQSHMVIGKTKGLLCEWSIKTKRATSDQKKPARLPDTTNYLEFIKYTSIK
jgi:hypothetical protein